MIYYYYTTVVAIYYYYRRGMLDAGFIRLPECQECSGVSLGRKNTVANDFIGCIMHEV